MPLRKYWILLAFLIVSACSYKPPDDPNARPGKGLNVFPVWYDNMLGAQHGELYRQELPLLRNDRIERGIEDLGMYLVQTYYGSEPVPFDFEFSVVDLDIMNAFALPGGKIFVFRGLLEDLETEAELAGVLAHEMGHVVARHGTKNMSKALISQGVLLTTTAVLVSKDREGLAAATYIGGTLGTSLALLKFSRNYEREADWVAVHQLYRAGYDPNAMITLFRHFEDQTKMKRGAMFMSSHPTPQERQSNVGRELPKLDLNMEWKGSQFGFAEIKQELAKLPPAPKELKGRNVLSFTNLDSLTQFVADSQASSLATEKNAEGTQTVRVYVPAHQQWTDTQIRLTAGQRVVFHSEGKIQWTSQAEDICGPSGVAGKGALMAAVAQNSDVTPFRLGRQAEIVAPAAGTLYLGIADDDHSDNSGWYVVSVKLFANQ